MYDRIICEGCREEAIYPDTHLTDDGVWLCGKCYEECAAAAKEQNGHIAQQPQADICPICQRKFYGSGVAGFCSDECNSMYYERI